MHVLRQHVARYEVRNREKWLCAVSIAPALRWEFEVEMKRENKKRKNNGAGGSQCIPPNVMVLDSVLVPQTHMLADSSFSFYGALEANGKYQCYAASTTALTL